MSFSGSCHCGDVAFTVEGDAPTEATSCNCSHCRRKGFLLAFVPAEMFTLDKGADKLTSYRFNKHQIEHLFCKTCGTQAFAYGSAPDGTEMRAINMRCVPEVDLDGLTINKVDGAAY